MEIICLLEFKLSIPEPTNDIGNGYSDHKVIDDLQKPQERHGCKHHKYNSYNTNEQVTTGIQMQQHNGKSYNTNANATTQKPQLQHKCKCHNTNTKATT